MYPSGQAIWGLAWKYTLLAKNWANTHVLCIRFLTACGISWSDFSSNHFDYENDPTMYMNEDFHQIIKFLTQMVWIFEIHIDWLIEWVADKAHLHERAFSTVCFQCPNFRNGRPNTKLFHQNKPVIGGQKEFLPKQKLLLTTAHRRWSRGRWSEDRTPLGLGGIIRICCPSLAWSDHTKGSHI